MMAADVRVPAVRRRRRWGLRLALLGSVLLLVAGLALGAAALLWARADIDTTGEVDFDRELRIPPLLEGETGPDGERVFDLELERGATDFGRGRETETWGVNGTFLGPTLRAERGDRVRMHVTNDVGETTTLHWHGMHLPAEMDGGPHQPVDPGSTWSPTWPIDQPAGTLWYHPHLMGKTAEHVYRGLAGMFILDDPEASALSLPDTYGVDDIPVIVQDRSFDDDGQFEEGEPMFSPTGFLGDTILVNGTPGAYQKVTTEKVRLRLLNASNARVYNFGFDDDRTYSVIGTDGGLLPEPVEVTRLRLSPGERADVVVTMRPGTTSVLRSYPADLGADPWNERFGGGDDTFDVLQLRAADTLEPSESLPETLASQPRLDEGDATETRTFRLGGTNINHDDMDMDRIDEDVTVGDTEIWEVSNESGSPHSFHVHDVQFNVLDVDGREPPPELAGSKDTAYVEPNSTMRLIMRFDDYADADTPYMFHCHLLRHEDQGMMGQFVVTEPGEETGAPEHEHGMSH